MLKYPNIDPVIMHIYGAMAIRWYSLAYIFGFTISILFFKRQNKKFNLMPSETCDNLLTWGILGLLIGARLFDCLVYNLFFTIKNPISIFKVWEGGMSFHGGLIGVMIAVFIFGKLNKINPIRILDLLVVMVPLALLFGRIANFINGELYGNITYTSPFAMIFPTDPAQQPRHPSQLYESFTEGFCLFLIMWFLFSKTKLIECIGAISGCFGLFYSIARFICEFFRKPEISNFLTLTAGQIISIIMFVASCVWLFLAFKHKLKNI